MIMTVCANSDSPKENRILFIDEDQLYRETIKENLQHTGFQVADFECGEKAWSYLKNGGASQLVLLEWKLPTISGFEFGQRLRKEKYNMPVVFLTDQCNQVYEEAALMNGAIDYIDKARSFSIVLRRILTALKFTSEVYNQLSPTSQLPSKVLCSELEMNPLSHRVLWRGKPVALTLAEFKIVQLLAAENERDVTHREIYDIVRGPGFVSGEGAHGYRSNVRTFIKRIRKKFCTVDGEFDRIGTYSGFGYRWTLDNVPNNVHSLIGDGAAMTSPVAKLAI
jgi:two-component system response regulator ChvI